MQKQSILVAVSTLVISVALATAAKAEATEAETTPSSALVIMNFQGNAIAIQQSAGGDFLSGQFAWNPSLVMGPVRIVGNVGVAGLKNAFDRYFPSVNGQVFAQRVLVSKLGIQVGGGMQTWFTNGGTHPIASGNLYWGFSSKFFGVFDRIYAGYSRFFMNNSTDEYRLGLGITI